MNMIKWETVKTKAIQAKCLTKSNVICADFIHMKESHFYLSLLAAIGENKKPLDVLENWMQKAQKIIENWDIRRARQLIELCDLKIKGYSKGCKIVADYDQSGDWALFFD